MNNKYEKLRNYNEERLRLYNKKKYLLWLLRQKELKKEEQEVEYELQQKHKK